MFLNYCFIILCKNIQNLNTSSDFYFLQKNTSKGEITSYQFLLSTYDLEFIKIKKQEASKANRFFLNNESNHISGWVNFLKLKSYEFLRIHMKASICKVISKHVQYYAFVTIKVKIMLQKWHVF